MEQKQPLSKLSAALNKEADILSSEDVSATDEIVQSLKNCIESIYPNSNWWEVCNFDMDGFAARDGVTVQDIIEAIIAHIKPEFVAEESKVEESVHGEASITMDQFNPEQLVQHCKERQESLYNIIEMKDNLETEYHVFVSPHGLVDKPYRIDVDIIKEAFPSGVDMDTPEAYERNQDRVVLKSFNTYDEVIAFLNEWKASMMPKKESMAESTVNEDSPLPFEDKIDQVKDIVNKWAREGFNEKKHPFMDMDEFKRMADKYHEKRPFKGVFHQAQADVYWDKKNKHWTMSFDFGSASKNKGLTELNKRLQSLGIKATAENAEWDDGNDMVDFEQATDKAPVEEAMPSNVGWGLKAWMLNEIISHMDNEEAYSGGWLYIWPDGSTKQDAIDYFGTPEDYKELEDSFKSHYKAYHKDGMYFGLDKSLTEADINKIMATAHAWDKKLGLSPIADVGKEKSLKYDEDTIEDDLISEAASRIASAYGTDVASAYDDLINAQDEKYANHSYPSVDDLEGTYGGPLDEKLISRWNNKWDSKGNFVITKSGKKISKGDKDKDGYYVTGFDPESNSIFIDSDPNVDGGADYDVNEYEDEIVDTKIKESNESNRFNDFGKTWSVFKIHMHGSEPKQEVAKGLSSREAVSKVTSLRAAEKDKDISYVSRSAENDKFIKSHQKPINNKDSNNEEVEEDFKDRQKSIHCLKDLGKNYNFDRFSDQQLYVMCKRAQREAQQLAQEHAEMEDELENCSEAQTCPQCGGPLNDAGECPKCDLGDEDESLKEEISFKDIDVNDDVDETSFWDMNSLFGNMNGKKIMQIVLHLAKKYYIYNHDNVKNYGVEDALENAFEHIDANGVDFDPTVDEYRQLKDTLTKWIDGKSFK